MSTVNEQDNVEPPDLWVISCKECGSVFSVADKRDFSKKFLTFYHQRTGEVVVKTLPKDADPLILSRCECAGRTK